MADVGPSRGPRDALACPGDHRSRKPVLPVPTLTSCSCKARSPMCRRGRAVHLRHPAARQVADRAEHHGQAAYSARAAMRDCLAHRRRGRTGPPSLTLHRVRVSIPPEWRIIAGFRGMARGPGACDGQCVRPAVPVAGALVVMVGSATGAAAAKPYTMYVFPTSNDSFCKVIGTTKFTCTAEGRPHVQE
jgi:hypothetical protein